ncbi:MAG: heteromeric transposase endonuclease subunit TnsA [Candidatus Asgardarchaeum californiense]|nr:MAG: heteromeric transposase endonuclease subunit TnsA [Candidatus Asgardarchaeum californiense]
MKISMKKRKVGYTYGSVSGHFAFRKQKSIAFESTLERDLLTLLEFNDSVDDVIEQPLTIEYVNHNGRAVTYTPDFLVDFKEAEASLLKRPRKPLLIEVKPREKLQKHFKELKPRFKVAMRYAHANDMIFKIYDESKIRTPYLNNILFLKRYKRLTYREEDESNILAYINSSGSITIEAVIEYLFISKEQKSIGLGQIWHLLANKKLLCNFSKMLDKQTIVWVNDNLLFGGDDV